MAFSALMAVGWVSSSGANVMARRAPRWSMSALTKELLPPPPAPMSTYACSGWLRMKQAAGASRRLP